jgi:hypothetical protein
VVQRYDPTAGGERQLWFDQEEGEFRLVKPSAKTVLVQLRLR